jgi:hypothetical protein
MCNTHPTLRTYLRPSYWLNTETDIVLCTLCFALYIYIYIPTAHICIYTHICKYVCIPAIYTIEHLHIYIYIWKLYTCTYVYLYNAVWWGLARVRGRGYLWLMPVHLAFSIPRLYTVGSTNINMGVTIRQCCRAGVGAAKRPLQHLYCYRPSAAPTKPAFDIRTGALLPLTLTHATLLPSPHKV